MLTRFSRRLWLLLLLVPAFARGADRWAQLKTGMTTDETVAALGEPLARNLGRGFELWTYDNHAEVLFFGDLIGWTSPGQGPALTHSFDIWQANRGKDDFRSALLMLPPKRSKPKKERPNIDMDGTSLEWRPSLRFMH